MMKITHINRYSNTMQYLKRYVVMKSNFTRTFLFISTIVCISACQDLQPRTSLSLELKEVYPGILEGYLSNEETLDSLKLLPPPPKDGSIAYQRDQEIAAGFVASTDDVRKEQAYKDSILLFPEAVKAFTIIPGIEISKELTPHLYVVLRRSLADSGGSTYAAKVYYKRQRPFVVNDTPTCTPDEEERIRTDGSYPSGHTAIGWAWALILSEVYPDKSNEIITRGREFGISRNVCNVHWRSDIVFGRMMGAATVARLHANEFFLNDIEAAKKEIE